MSEKVELVKEVYGRNTYPRVVDIQFSELYNPVVADTVSEQVTVEAFFDLYNQLFFEIPATGEVNSHEYLVARSTEERRPLRFSQRPMMLSESPGTPIQKRP